MINIDISVLAGRIYEKFIGCLFGLFLIPILLLNQENLHEGLFSILYYLQFTNAPTVSIANDKLEDDVKIVTPASNNESDDGINVETPRVATDRLRKRRVRFLKSKKQD